MNRFNFLLLALGLFTLSACTTKPFGFDVYSRIDAFDYYEWVLHAEVVSLQEERTRFESIPADEQSAERFVQHAILLSARNENGVSTDIEALALMDSADFNVLSKEYRAFATLWMQILNARQLAKTHQDLIGVLEHERVTLQTQIDALTSIEQQLNRRESLQDL